MICKSFWMQLVLGIIQFVGAPPVDQKIITGVDFSSEKLIMFMQKYGYLQAPDDRSEGIRVEYLYSEDAIVDGIKNIQKFGGIPQTGTLNEQTITLLKSPRCGVKDIDFEAARRQKRYIIGSKSWQKRRITYFIGNWSNKVDQEKMIRWVSMGFDAWAKYGNLKFTRVFDPSADIIIAFGSQYHGDRYPFDGQGNILAHAFYPYEENAYGGDIHFDNDENWLEGAANLNQGVDFLTVLVHEIGHSLGLAHSPVLASIMFPYYKGPTEAQLEYDDILALYQLYIQATLDENSLEENSLEVTNEHISTTKTPATDSVTVQQIETTEKHTNTNEHDDADYKDEKNPTITIHPDLCDGNFDAMGVLEDKIYVFKDRSVWRVNQKFETEDGFPVEIHKIFPNLPKRFRKIDAVYRIPESDEVFFFSGSEFITYDIRGPIYNSYNITRYTYDPDIERIDAAMIWAKNKKTYLFAADRFWKYNTESRQMYEFYPRIMGRWNGVPENLDAAISLSNGMTIFFKGAHYWMYDSDKLQPKSGFPKTVDHLFAECRY